MDSDEEMDPDAANVAVQRQTQRLRKVWRQQLKSPHAHIEDTYRAYQAWEQALFGQAATQTGLKDDYAAMKRLAKAFAKHEAQLATLAPNVSPGFSSAERVAC